MPMWSQMYGWWSWLMALPPAAGLGVWLWLSPTAHRLLRRASRGGRAEYRLGYLRLHGRISIADYQRGMADLAHRASHQPSHQSSELTRFLKDLRSSSDGSG